MKTESNKSTLKSLGRKGEVSNVYRRVRSSIRSNAKNGNSRHPKVDDAVDEFEYTTFVGVLLAFVDVGVRVWCCTVDELGQLLVHTVVEGVEDPAGDGVTVVEELVDVVLVQEAVLLLGVVAAVVPVLAFPRVVVEDDGVLLLAEAGAVGLHVLDHVLVAEVEWEPGSRVHRLLIVGVVGVPTDGVLEYGMEILAEDLLEVAVGEAIPAVNLLLALKLLAARVLRGLVDVHSGLSCDLLQDVHAGSE